MLRRRLTYNPNQMGLGVQWGIYTGDQTLVFIKLGEAQKMVGQEGTWKRGEQDCPNGAQAAQVEEKC